MKIKVEIGQIHLSPQRSDGSAVKASAFSGQRRAIGNVGHGFNPLPCQLFSNLKSAHFFSIEFIYFFEKFQVKMSLSPDFG